MTRTASANFEKISKNPDKYLLSLGLDSDHNTVFEFEVELTKNAARRLMIDMTHEMELPEVSPKEDNNDV